MKKLFVGVGSLALAAAVAVGCSREASVKPVTETVKPREASQTDLTKMTQDELLEYWSSIGKMEEVSPRILPENLADSLKILHLYKFSPYQSNDTTTSFIVFSSDDAALKAYGIYNRAAEYASEPGGGRIVCPPDGGECRRIAFGWNLYSQYMTL